MTAVAFKVVEGRSVKGGPILYVYGQKYMGSLFCADQAEAEAFKGVLRAGAFPMDIALEESTFEQKERTS